LAEYGSDNEDLGVLYQKGVLGILSGQR